MDVKTWNPSRQNFPLGNIKIQIAKGENTSARKMDAQKPLWTGVAFTRTKKFTTEKYTGASNLDAKSLTLSRQNIAFGSTKTLLIKE